MPLRDRLLVDAGVGRHARVLGALAALDGPLHDVPGLVPADTRPRRLEAQQMAVEFEIVPDASPPGEIELEPPLHHLATHGEAG